MTNPKPGCLPKFLHRFGQRSAPAAAARPVQSPIAQPEPMPYRLRDDFLSPAEASFYRVLKQVVGEHLLVCPKVSLDDIFFVAHPEQHYAYLNKINRKHVDFLVCDPQSLKPVAGIELDDASHRRADRVERDEFVEQVFATAGLPLLRFPVRTGYASQEIIQQLRGVLKTGTASPVAGAGSPMTGAASPVSGAVSNSPIGVGEAKTDGAPLCPKCGLPMVIRTAQRGEQAGRQFYGCPNYPRCREIKKI